MSTGDGQVHYTYIYRIGLDAPAFDFPDPQAARADFRAVVEALTAARGGEPPDLQTAEAAFRDELKRENPALVPIAEHTLRNVDVPCGVDRVRLVAGRHELRIFLTRRDAECGEEEIRYNLATGEWTPESWHPSAPPIQPSDSPLPDKKQEPSR